MNLRLRLFLSLISLHLLVLLFIYIDFNFPSGVDLLPILLFMIYFPLAPFSTMGIPVLTLNGSLFPPPNILGWILVFSAWLLIHWTSSWIIAFSSKKIWKNN